jgi:hypothetical protein
MVEGNGWALAVLGACAVPSARGVDFAFDFPAFGMELSLGGLLLELAVTSFEETHSSRKRLVPYEGKKNKTGHRERLRNCIIHLDQKALRETFFHRGSDRLALGVKFMYYIDLSPCL